MTAKPHGILGGGEGGGWGPLIFSRIRRLGPFFGFGFQKNKYFWGYEDFVDIFLGSSENWASFRFISMHFRVFFKVKGTELRYFWGVAKISNIFSGA